MVLKRLFLTLLFLFVASNAFCNSLTPNELRQKQGVVKVYNDSYSANVNTAGQLEVNSLTSSGAVSVEDINTTTTPLTGSGTFTGTWEQNKYPQVMVSMITDVAGTLYFDFSNDGTNLDSTFPTQGFVVSGGIHEFHTAVKGNRYFRVRYVNGSSVQSYLRLYTYYGSDFVPSVAPLNQTASLDQDAIFTRGTIPQDEITLGRRSGVTSWGKFGYDADVDTTEVVASFGGLYAPLSISQNFTVSYTNTTDGSGTAGARQLRFYYTDSDGLPASSIHELSTTGTDVTSFQGYGINRLEVYTAGISETNVSAINVQGATTGTTQAQIPAGDSSTQQAIFHTGSNHKAIVRDLEINIRKLSGGAIPRVTVRGWKYNRTRNVKTEIFRWDIDTGVENSILFPGNINILLNETESHWYEAETNVADTIVGVRFNLNEYQNT